MTEPPGLLACYPNLRETLSSDPRERTEWNVRDSDATLVLLPSAPDVSPGTQFTLACVDKYAKAFLVADPNDPSAARAISDWLSCNTNSRVLNIAGPRESELPGVYAGCLSTLGAL